MPPQPGEEDGRPGCFVLAVGPGADIAWIAEAAGHAREAVLADAVFGGTARVAALTRPHLDGDLGALAGAVAEELLGWALSPANPAGRVVFGVLVVHPDPPEADVVVRALSAAEPLAQLPVVVLAGAPGPVPPDPEQARDPHTEVVHMILDAVAALVRDAETTPSLVVDVASLDAAEAPPPPADPATPGPAVCSPWWRRPVPQRTPVTDLDLIDELSEIADHVAMLYIVLVSEPSRPRRRGRRRRLDVATELGRAVLGRAAATPPDHWYVRAFTAGERLRPGSPLAAVAPPRALDMPQRRAEPLDVSRCVDDLRDTVRIDRAAFVRRELHRPRTVVVFVADGPPPATVEGQVHLARLSVDARVAWLDVRPDATAEPAVAAAVSVLHDHKDVVGELVELVVGESPGSPARRARR